MEHSNAEKIKSLLEQANFETCDPGKRHNPVEVMERNAAFLIESSHKIVDYDKDILVNMQKAFELKNYPRVIDLAYQHDRKLRCKASLDSYPSNSHLNRVKCFIANVLNLL